MAPSIIPSSVKNTSESKLSWSMFHGLATMANESSRVVPVKWESVSSA